MTWRALGFDAVLQPAAALALWTAIFGGMALWRFRWESDS
jgi:lipopolysaccharide export LptBFGC system permease protein LptF